METKAAPPQKPAEHFPTNYILLKTRRKPGLWTIVLSVVVLAVMVGTAAAAYWFLR